MSYLQSYKRLNKLILNESYEPMLSWGLRMALAGTLPVIWGLASGHLSDAVWVTLTAEAITWVEMKGSFAWRARTLLMAAILAVSCSMLGTVTGASIGFSVIAMLATGFLATLLKSIGDRASGLGLCVYLMFIICNAFPATSQADVMHRLLLVCIGAAWPVVVSIFISLLMPAGEPFRRQIALIWRAIAELTAAVSETGSSKHTDVYLREKDVRTAIDNSYQFYGRMAHQVDKKDNTQYQLAQLRKTAGLVSVNILAIGEQTEHITLSDFDESLRIKAATLMNIMREAINRVSIFVITLKPEEKLLAVSQINRMKKFNELLRQYPLPPAGQQTAAIRRIIQLSDRTVKLLEHAILRIDHMGTDVPVYRSYSFIKTLFVLRPKYIWRNIRVLFNFNTLTTRYALRSAIAATAALFIYKWFQIDHGYWLPFTVMIVIQPYFGATLKRALDRIVGTIAGGLAGSLLLYLPVGMHFKELILFLSFIFMVYFIRKQYAVAVFVITLNLVLLFNLESAYNNMLMVTRAICTTGGALLAIISGFALLPDWDRKWLPEHLGKAILNNYNYFRATFYSDSHAGWTRMKRAAESATSNVFDSFNRYIDEPGKANTELYYGIITTNVRITRNLNNIHLEQDEKKSDPAARVALHQQERINECLHWFSEVVALLPALSASVSLPPAPTDAVSSPFPLNEAQLISLEKLIIELKTMKADLGKLSNG